MRSPSVLPVLLITTVLACSAFAESIEILSPTGQPCMQMQAFVPTTISIIAFRSDQTVEGIRGAEFRVDNLDPTWFVSIPTGPCADCEPSGTPASGLTFAFASCRHDPACTTRIADLQVIALSVPAHRFLTIRESLNPTNPAFQCPTLVLCDAPNFTRICATGGTLEINGSMTCAVDGPPRGDCSVGVQSDTWSRVKGDILASPFCLCADSVPPILEGQRRIIKRYCIEGIPLPAGTVASGTIVAERQLSL